MSKKEKYYIAVNTGEKFPLLKDTMTCTEYFKEALVFSDLISVHRYIEKQAMDRCVSKSEIAKSIISTYS